LTIINIKGNQKTIMAKKISTKVNYQVTELVNNLNEAATTQSEQKRDFFTTRALYNAKRLSTILSTAKVGAMALILVLGMSACGTSTATETKTDSTKVEAAKIDSANVGTATNDSTAKIK
jgi:16S rRNA G527 N7-methylase RsmG